MQKNDTFHSILIVSAAETVLSGMMRSFAGFYTIDTIANAAAARRCILERYYDLIIVNGLLPDETGEELAIDAADSCNASVLLLMPQEMFEETLDQVTDHGVLMLPKPVSRGRLDKALRYLIAVQDRIHSLEKKVQAAEEKLEEQKLVSRAKLLLMERRGLKEEDAHRLIGKTAMDNGISRGKAARRILDDME